MPTAVKGEAKKVIRMREGGATDFTKVTVYVEHVASNGRNRYGFDPAEWLGDSFGDMQYDGNVSNYVIVGEKLDKETFEKEIESVG